MMITLGSQHNPSTSQNSGVRQLMRRSSKCILTLYHHRDHLPLSLPRVSPHRGLGFPRLRTFLLKHGAGSRSLSINAPFLQCVCSLVTPPPYVIYAAAPHTSRAYILFYARAVVLCVMYTLMLLSTRAFILFASYPLVLCCRFYFLPCIYSIFSESLVGPRRSLFLPITLCRLSLAYLLYFAFFSSFL
ncbi:hypothetical protein GGX14DRAFT_442488, partial [Mycena pura]